MAGSSEEGFDVTALRAFLIVELLAYYIPIVQMCKGKGDCWSRRWGLRADTCSEPDISILLPQVWFKGEIGFDCFSRTAC